VEHIRLRVVVLAKDKKKKEKKPKELTPQQIKFCEEYLRNNQNGTQAAIKAGYATKSAPTTANRLLNENELVKEYIESRIKKVIAQEIYDTDTILKQYTKMAKGELVEEEETKVLDGEWSFSGTGRSSYTPTHIIKTKTMRAEGLKRLGDHLGIFKNANPLDQGINIVVTLNPDK